MQISNQVCVGLLHVYLIQAAPLAEKLLVATWSAKGHVNIWDMTSHMTTLSLPVASATYQSVKGLKEESLFSFSGHQVENCWYAPVF